MFKNRAEAGKLLAQKLAHYRDTGALVLALPRGGVVVGAEVAQALASPLDIIAVRKVGHPHHPEYAIGAVDESGGIFMNEMETASIDQSWLKEEIKRERAEALRRARVYRGAHGPLNVEGKTVIIADDGIATGLTMRLAVESAKKRGAKKIVVAVPVAPPEAVAQLTRGGAEVVTLEPPEAFLGAVGAHYLEFAQTQDDEVIRLMRSSR